MIDMAQVIARQAEVVQRLLRPFFDPGHVVELPGCFRLSLTAPDEVAERSLPIFARAIEQARSIVRK